MKQQQEGRALVCGLDLRDTLHCSADKIWYRVLYISIVYSRSTSIHMLTVNSIYVVL